MKSGSIDQQFLHLFFFIFTHRIIALAAIDLPSSPSHLLKPPPFPIDSALDAGLVILENPTLLRITTARRGAIHAFDMLPSTLITALSLSLILPSTLAAPSLARQGVTAPRAASPAESYVKVRRRVSSGKQSHGRNRAREHKERACSEPEQESYNPPSTTPAIPTTPFSAMFPVSPRNSWSTADGQSNHKSSESTSIPNLYPTSNIQSMAPSNLSLQVVSPN